MIYAASKYLDEIKPRQTRHPEYQQDQYVYFDTEQEAKGYILARAADGLREAEGLVFKAKRRLAKVMKRFGPSSTAAVQPPC